MNLPARLVIVKGTEYFDGKLSRYVDYPLTDVLQMIGRAGRYVHVVIVGAFETFLDCEVLSH